MHHAEPSDTAPVATAPRAGAWQPPHNAYPAAVLAFLPAPDPLPPPADDGRGWRPVLLVSATLAAFATMRPWVRVQFPQLFGHHVGPPGWQSSAGFTCLCTCALVGMLALAETDSLETHQAVRPASVLLVAISALAFALEWGDGPGHLRGVSAVWTWAFWLTATSLPLLLLACAQRCRALQSRRRMPEM